MRNKTIIDVAGRLTVEFIERIRPNTKEDRIAIAKFIAIRMYGEGHVPKDIPYSDYPEKEFWVLDEHNDWFLQFKDDNSGVVIHHRNPEERHMQILGGLAHSLSRMTLIMLPSQLVHNPPVQADD